MTYVRNLCSFSSGLDDLTRRKQADRVEVLRILKARGRFSVFEVTDNVVIAKTMDRIGREKLIEYDNTRSAYPWSYVTLTPAGLALIGIAVTVK